METRKTTPAQQYVNSEARDRYAKLLAADAKAKRELPSAETVAAGLVSGRDDGREVHSDLRKLYRTIERVADLARTSDAELQKQLNSAKQGAARAMQPVQAARDALAKAEEQRTECDRLVVAAANEVDDRRMHLAMHRRYSSTLESIALKELSIKEPQ